MENCLVCTSHFIKKWHVDDWSLHATYTFMLHATHVGIESLTAHGYWSILLNNWPNKTVINHMMPMHAKILPYHGMLPGKLKSCTWEKNDLLSIFPHSRQTMCENHGSPHHYMSKPGLGTIRREDASNNKIRWWHMHGCWALKLQLVFAHLQISIFKYWQANGILIVSWVCFVAAHCLIHA